MGFGGPILTSSLTFALIGVIFILVDVTCNSSSRDPRILATTRPSQKRKDIFIVLDLNGVLCHYMHTPHKPKHFVHKLSEMGYGSITPMLIGKETVNVCSGLRLVLKIVFLVAYIVLWSSVMLNTTWQSVDFFFMELPPLTWFLDMRVATRSSMGMGKTMKLGEGIVLDFWKLCKWLYGVCAHGWVGVLATCIIFHQLCSS